MMKGHANEAEYDLDRKTAKISSLSSNNFDKYEYLAGDNLGLKPSNIEQTKLEDSPLGKTFNKGLSEDDKKERLFKRLKNLEDKNEKNDIDLEKFVCVTTFGTLCHFNKFKPSQDMASSIYKIKKLLKDGENKQSEIKILLNK